MNVECEICHVDAPEADMCLGWGGHVCTNNPDCRPPLIRPRQRMVADLTEIRLDHLEWEADRAENECVDAEVSHSVLRALVDAARRVLPKE